MTIESGTTSDRRNRIIMSLGLLLLFGGWFAYDGFVSYPAKNMKWARQFLNSVPGMADRADLRTNPQARLDALRQVKQDMPLDDVKRLLGEPTFENGTDYCYIGPASFGWYAVRDGKVAEIKRVEENSEPSEGDVRNNRYISAVLALVALGVFLHLIRVLRSRIVLDDAGLRIRGQTIGWGDMQGLDAREYARKGWIDLQCAGSQSVRLDGYEIDRFDEIVGEICNRKGFASPLAPPEDEARAGS